MASQRTRPSEAPTGKLRIGDQWNAITIIALSQNNPLKAVAEFVENSIDAGASQITITRGRDGGQHYLKIKDDGQGIRRDEQGVPDFQYVATHICDSIKRQMKRQGTEGVQGEYGIGLLSFWTVGEELWLSSAGADGKMYQMHMRKHDPSYRVTQKRPLLPEPGTELIVRPILPGLRQLSGEKIQWYLASELRDRIRHSAVRIKVIDRAARAEYQVEPRQYDGRLLHEVEKVLSKESEVYLELYLTQPEPSHRVGLYRSGTRVIEDIAELPVFAQHPWTSGYLQGIVDVPYLNLTPGTRTGIIQDEALLKLASELEPVTRALLDIIEEQRKAEEERASRDVLKSIQKALKEALMALPSEEYDWFELTGRHARPIRKAGEIDSATPDPSNGTSEIVTLEEDHENPDGQRQFFEFPGPLFSVRISPTSSVMPVGGSKNFRAVARDRKRQVVEQDLTFHWSLVEGPGQLINGEGEIVTFQPGSDPGLVRLKVTVRQGTISCDAEAMVTVVQDLMSEPRSWDRPFQGIPSYTFQKAAGELWRSQFQPDQNIIVINSGHRDFVYASRNKALKLRYISRLFAKELVLRNFTGMAQGELLERLIELSLYTEENLK